MTTTTDAPVTPALDRAEAITQGKKLWHDALYMKSPATWWCYSAGEITAFRQFLADNSLTLDDVGIAELDVQKLFYYRHFLAAEEAWRLCFKNNSAVSVAGRLMQMELNLRAIGKSRRDLGLLEESAEWITQHPDLSAAIMNAGRVKWIPRSYDYHAMKFRLYQISEDGTLVERPAS